MPYYKITVNAPQTYSTVVVANDLADARAKGIKQLGIVDPPSPGRAPNPRIDVGLCTRQEFVGSESKRLSIRPEDVALEQTYSRIAQASGKSAPA